MMTTSRAWVTASCPSVRNTTAPTVTMAPIVSTSVSAASSTTPLATLRAAFSLTGFGKLNSSRVVMTCPLSFALRSDLVILSCVTRGSRFGTASRGAESLDVAGLPGRLDRPSVVVLADEGDRLTGGYAIQHGQTAEGSARPAAPAAAGDFHPFVLGPAPCLAQRISRVVLVDG